MHLIYYTVRHFLIKWGYWAILAGLLGESAGLPVPGETTLMFSGFLAHKGVGLHLIWIILIGIAAATVGDNIGFLLGWLFGPRLLRWMKKVLPIDEEDVAVAKDQIRRHGAATVFWARFIFGLREVAGPLAGILGMKWRKFLLFNFLGALSWVITMSFLGYVFADQFSNLLAYVEKVSWIIVVGLLSLAYFLWHHQKKRFEERRRKENHA